MSSIGFITKAIAISPIVFLRYLPILAIFVLIMVGLFQTTDNIWVIGMIGFLVATIGQTFLYVQGIRGALQTLRVTDAPTVEGLMHVTIRVMFTQMLFLLFFVVAVSASLYFIVSTFVLSDAAADAADVLGSFIGAVFSFDGDKIAEAAFALNQLEGDPGPLKAALNAFNISVQLAIGIGISLLGIPMAAMSANAVQKSPGNDLIFGIGRYFPHQLFLYILFTILPTVILTAITPVSALTPGGEEQTAIPLGAILLALWSIYAPCVSFAAMALGYQAIQKKVWGRLQREKTPDIDYEAERQNVRALRELRREKVNETTVYDPKQTVQDLLDVDSEPMPDDIDFEDEVKSSLRAMRQARRGGGGPKVYDPRNKRDGD